ncbi:unnamed protein product [Sphagnum jensenii]
MLRENLRFLRRREGIGVGEEERKAPLLKRRRRGADPAGSLAGSLLTVGMRLKLLPPSFPHRYLPSFHSPRLRSLQTHYRRL